jgi:hypothetical protein
MDKYGPNTEQVERFITDAQQLTGVEFDRVGAGWRALAVPHVAGPPDVNVHVANAMRAAQDVMSLRKLLNDLNPAAESSLPVPTDDQLHRAVRAGSDARTAVSTMTPNNDAQEAIAGMAGVLALRPWIMEPLVENVLAPFVAVRPGWLESA